MKGLSLADRHLYWSIRKVLLQVREYSLIRKASSMTASLSDSQSSGKALLRMREEITACASRQAEILQEYLRMYGVPLLASPLK